MSLPIQEYINNGSVEHLRDAITGELTRCMMCGERIQCREINKTSSSVK